MENVFFVITEKWFVVLDLYISLYISLHVLSSFFFWPVYCLFFFDLRLLITFFKLSFSYIFIAFLSKQKLYDVITSTSIVRFSDRICSN